MMARLYRVFSRVTALFRQGRLDRDLEEDLATHLELLTDDLVRRGMSPDAARRAARLRFGSHAGATELHRDVRSLRWIEASLRDVRYAARVLRKAPLFTCAVVVTLGLGIGGTMSVFSLLSGFTFQPPVSRDPDAFFRVLTTGRGTSASWARYEAYRDQSLLVRQLAAWSRFRFEAPLGADDPARVQGLVVTCNFFDVLGVDVPIAGRLLGPADCALGSTAAVLSDRFWRRRFGGDPSVIGTSHRYGTVPITIVGVAAAPPIQREPEEPDAFLADLWFPLTAQPALSTTMTFFAGSDMFAASNSHAWLEIAGLLKPGVSRAAATTEFRLIAVREDPRAAADAAIVLTDGSRWSAAPAVMLGLIAALVALPALVMITASVNVAALLLSRAVSRHREMAIRLALGTSKGGLVRMLMIESLLLSGLAAGVALCLVYTAPPLLVRYFDAAVWFGGALRPDWRVFLALAACGVLTAVLSGLTPAIQAAHPRLAAALLGRPALGSTRGTSHTRRVFVGIQVAASVVPLVLAVTFAGSVTRFLDPSIRTDGVFVTLVPDGRKDSPTLSALADAAASVPGVTHVAYATWLPLVHEDSMPVRLLDQSRDAYPKAASVSPDFFAAFDIPILAGRSFHRRDGEGAGPTPAVISSQLARRLFGAGDVLGQVIEARMPTSGKYERVTVVGICADRTTGQSSRRALNDGSMIHLPMSPAAQSGRLIVRAEAAGPAFDVLLGARLREPMGMPLPVTPFETVLDDSVVVVRQMLRLLVGLGLLSFLLAGVGVIGMVTFDANQKRKEFAVRLALGADPWAVRRRVLSSGVWPVPIGIACGLLASWGALKIIESARVLPLAAVASEPLPYLAIPALLLSAALGALVIVAYPVGLCDPLAALREE
jgi:predicted permease